MIQWQMSNLVIGVGPCPTRITPATSDRVGACGTKLLNGFVKSPVAGRSTASLPVRPQCTNTARAWQARKFLPREGSPAGDWFAPEQRIIDVGQTEGAFQRCEWKIAVSDQHALELRCLAGGCH